MIKTNIELAAMAKKVATDYKTLYVMGCFGAPMTQRNKTRWINNYAFNRRSDRDPKIQAATADTFGFDCICFVKGLLWGWDGDTSHVYGGAEYKSNGVPDIGTEQMLKVCTDVSSDFSNIEIGEYVWMPGHCGIYIGDGLAVEATNEDADGVQIQAVLAMGTVEGYPATGWVKHGKLPYVEYVSEPTPAPTPAPAPVVEDRTTTLNVTILRTGDKGLQVMSVQQLLQCRGYALPEYGADGDFGSETEGQVKAFQRDKGLPQSGEVDWSTWSYLIKDTL